MRKIHYLLLSIVLLFPAAESAAQSQVCYTVPGALEYVVLRGHPYSPRSMKVKGRINGDDIAFIRQLAGGCWNIQLDTIQNPTLRELDLSEAKVQFGGMAVAFYSGHIENYGRWKHYNKTDTVVTYQFANCKSLQKLSLPLSTKFIEYEAFIGAGITALEVPSGAGLGYNAFYNCKHLAEVTLPASTTTLPKGVFYGCDSLARIVVKAAQPPVCQSNTFDGFSPENCELIVPKGSKESYMSDSEWSKFKEIKEQDLAAIGEQFVYNGLIYEKTGNDEVSVVGYDGGLDGELQLPQTVENKGNTYRVTEIADSAFADATGLTSVSIGEGVSRIGMAAFLHCTGLGKVTLPASLKSMGESVFSRCAKLKSLTVPEGVSEIPVMAFALCDSLTELVLPSTMSLFGYYSFIGASRLDKVILPVEHPFDLMHTGAFSPSVPSGCKLYVPDNSVDEYKSTEEWRYFDVLPISGLTDGVNSVSQQSGKAETAVYSLDGGRQPSADSKGIYIIGNSNDGYRKVLVK